MTFKPPVPFNCFDYFLGDRIREGLGDRRALLTAEGEVTYAGVFELSGRFARILLDEDVRPEERVIIALPDGPEYVGALFGILRAGAVVVMVNPDLPADQIRYFFEYSRARAALVHTGVVDAFREAAEGARHAPHILEVGNEAFGARLAASSPDVTPFESHPDDAAIWLFSGGTTGKPKAVVQPHRSFANTTELYAKGVLGMTAKDVTVSVPKLFFGYATGLNLLFPFSVGGAVVLFPDRCTPEALFAQIERFRPTALVNVPTMINKLLGYAGAAGQDLSCLRFATSAGEALPVDLHRRWDETFGVPLLDGLGTAEMWHIFVSNRVGDVRPGSLGKVVPGFEIKVCDASGREVGPGEVGNLWVRGGSRAIGYWQQIEKTEAAFQGEWYASGDMISMDGEGYVTYQGRADDMLKVSGKWLAPKELEDCLGAHPVVHEVAVVGVPNAEGLIVPRAVVVPVEDAGGRVGEGGLALADELKQWARDHLEPYKYPREVVFVDDFPRTHLGKVDRGALARNN